MIFKVTIKDIAVRGHTPDQIADFIKEAIETRSEESSDIFEIADDTTNVTVEVGCEYG